MTEAEREQILDKRIQRRLATDRAYRNAENAEEQSEREAEIEREEDAKLAGGHVDLDEGTPVDDDELLDEVYGVDRDYPCVYGHFDCATTEGGACANETYAKRLAAKHLAAEKIRNNELHEEFDRFSRGIHDAGRWIGGDTTVALNSLIGIAADLVAFAEKNGSPRDFAADLAEARARLEVK